MAQFKIIIKGIAMVYHKFELDGEWRVILPFGDRFDANNDCHEIKFFDYEIDEKILAGNKTITFETEGLKNNFKVGAGYDTFIDITAPYAHANGVTRRTDWNDYGVLMTIPQAEFAVYESSLCQYQLMDGNVKRFEPRIIGYCGQATITARALTVLVDGEPVADPYTSSRDLIFDNNCYKYKPMAKPSDFRMIYSILDPIRDDFLEVKRNPIQLPINVISNDEGESSFSQPKQEEEVKVPLIPPDSPIPNPRLYEYGLPCHMVTIGSPEDLP
jgi:hypothetical protein